MKKVLILFLVGTLSLLAGCSSSKNNDTPPSQSSENDVEPSDTPTPTPTEQPTSTPMPTPTETPTPEPHTHSYNESITKEVNCMEAGQKTFTCDCGDTYTEDIPATGHQFGEYKSNGDATYTADGTETATCACGSTDTRTVEGSKLTYTYTELSATMYAKSAVNVRDLPSTDGNKLGGLSSGQAVTVTGKCNETDWYRIDYNGNVAYVNNSYLVDNKPEEPKPEEPKPEEPSESDKPGECPYPLYQPVDNWTSISWYYVNTDEGVFNSNAVVNTLCERHGVNYCDIAVKWTGYFYNGGEVAYMTVSIPQ